MDTHVTTTQREGVPTVARRQLDSLSKPTAFDAITFADHAATPSNFGQLTGHVTQMSPNSQTLAAARSRCEGESLGGWRRGNVPLDHP